MVASDVPLVSTKPCIVQVGPLSGDLEAALDERYDIARLWEADNPTGLLAEIAGRAQAVVTSARHGCNGEVVRALPGLKAICSQGVGFDTIDLEAARIAGIPVSYTPDVLSSCVADLAWGLLIGGARRLAEGDAYVRNGDWAQNGAGRFPLSIKVSGKRLGIVGLGRIGFAIAERSQGFGMAVRYHNRRRRLDLPQWTYEASLHALAKWADIWVVATAGGAGTYHLVTSEVINALGPSGIFVNVARGSVVDEVALCEALEEGRLGAAGLDVFEDEPRPLPGLIAQRRAMLSPHVGGGTHETRAALEMMVLDNLASALAGRGVLTPIPRQQLR